MTNNVAVKIGIRWVVFAAAAAIAFGISVSGAVGGSNPVLVVTPAACCSGQGFTVETLDGTVTGTVPDPVGAEPGAFGVAADGAVAYDDASQGANDSPSGSGPVWLVAPNRTPLELDSSVYDFDASISYDGSQVVFARWDPATGSSDIYVAGVDGSGPTLVASGQGANSLSFPEFSPDGNSIAYSCGPGNTDPGTSLGCGPTVEGTYAGSGEMLMNADGSDQRMILMGGYGHYFWSPDGRSLAGTACEMTVVANVWSCGPTQVFVYRVDGSDLFKLEDTSLQLTHETVANALLDPQFSPDGTQLLFMKVVDNAWALYGIDSDGTNEQPTALAPQSAFAVVPPATGGGPPPTVNTTQPAGVGLGPIVVRSEIDQCRGLIELAANGAYSRCLPFPAGGDGATYSPAADGSVVLSDDNAGTGGDGGPVWLVKSDGQDVELDKSPYDFDPSISHDGSKITFARLAPSTNSSDIYTINSDGSDLTRVASGGRTNVLSTPTFSPDGGSIAYACYPVGPGATGEGCGPLADGTHQPTGVMLVKADGSDHRMILAGVSGPMSWSPDGKWLAMTHCVTKVVDNVWSCDPVQVFAYRTDGSDAFNADDPSRQVTHGTSIPQGAFDPQFSSDGTQILFGRTVDGNGAQGNFAYVVNRDGTDDHPVSLTPDPPIARTASATRSRPGACSCRPPAEVTRRKR